MLIYGAPNSFEVTIKTFDNIDVLVTLTLQSYSNLNGNYPEYAGDFTLSV